MVDKYIYLSSHSSLFPYFRNRLPTHDMIEKRKYTLEQRPSFLCLFNHFRYLCVRIIEVVIQHYQRWYNKYNKGCHFEQCLTTVWRLTGPPMLVLLFFYYFDLLNSFTQMLNCRCSNVWWVDLSNKISWEGKFRWVNIFFSLAFRLVTRDWSWCIRA